MNSIRNLLLCYLIFFLLTELSARYRTCHICNTSQSNLRRHLRTHLLDEEEISRLVYRQRIRNKNPKNKHYCPLEECVDLQPHQRLDQHFKKFHKLDETSDLYRTYIKKYNRKPKCLDANISSLEEVLDDFYEFLVSPNSKMTGEKNAKQQKYKLKQILIDCKVFTHEEAASSANELKFQKWFFQYSKDRCPNSAKTYLWVFHSYVEYLQLRLRSSKSINYKNLSSLKDVVQSWIKNMNKLHKKEPVKFHDNIPADDVTAFLNSPMAREVSLLVDILNGPTKNTINKEEHTLLRNFIFIMTILRNGCRPGVLANMTIQEFYKATSYRSEDSGETYFTVQVSNHKTAYSLGAAFVCLPLDLYNRYKMYLHKIRPYILQDKHCMDSPETFFLTWNGKELNSDDIHRGITSLWKKCGLKSKIGSTIIRKTITSEIHTDNDPTTIANIAGLQSHLPSTAEKWYRNQQKIGNMVEASAATFKVLTKQSKSDSKIIDGDLEETIRCEEDSTPNFDNSFSDNDHEMIEELPENPVNSPTHDNRQILIEKWKHLLPPKSHTRGRITFSHTERFKIFSSYIDYIDDDILPSLKQIRIRINEEECLSFLRGNKYKNCCSKLKGCLLNFLNKRKKYDI